MGVCCSKSLIKHEEFLRVFECDPMLEILQKSVFTASPNWILGDSAQASSNVPEFALRENPSFFPSSKERSLNAFLFLTNFLKQEKAVLFNFRFFQILWVMLLVKGGFRRQAKRSPKLALAAPCPRRVWNGVVFGRFWSLLLDGEKLFEFR